ncbi:MAG: NTP transferase domain-containing protein [Candidatus Methanoplasma sp.]|jgi:adenosylcobinamide-phosphate guanylyltransferase|nr:NTP transferase domain-containing protein [Candidatus Methanoplasma sp.]
MEALINAGGKGTRMGQCGTEKPMQEIGRKPVVRRVADALAGAKTVDRVLVSVSDHTPETERYLRDSGIETVRTSGRDFVGDIHEAFESMNGTFVLTCPSDLPLVTSEAIDGFAARFDDRMESLIAVVPCSLLRGMGIKPSYTRQMNGAEWVLSGITIMDREKTLRGEYLQELFYETDRREFAVNVNTKEELELARKLLEEDK